MKRVVWVVVIIFTALGASGCCCFCLPGGDASRRVATSINADLFLISTDVEQVALNFNTPDQQWLDRMTLDEAREYQAEGHLGAGSMGPKIGAVIRFLEGGGEQALITTPENIRRALDGQTGTWITRT